MALSFCPKCKNIMIPERKGEGFILTCSHCGFTENSKIKKDLVSKEKIKNEEVAEGVVDNENVFATYDHVCEKCGYDKAQVIDAGVFYTDEDYLILIRCGKCGWTERVGRKTN